MTVLYFTFDADNELAHRSGDVSTRNHHFNQLELTATLMGGLQCHLKLAPGCYPRAMTSDALPTRQTAMIPDR